MGDKGITKIRILMVIMVSILVLPIFGPGDFVKTKAESTDEVRKVRVAFFPMEGYHIINEDGTFDGIEVEYLKALSEYVNWKVEYVVCDSWEDALEKLKNKEIDLVGTAQYSDERSKIYDYASVASGYTFGAIATNADMDVAYEDFEKMKEITYGIVKGYVKEKEFYKYLEENGVTNPKVTEYDSTKELQKALENKEVDAMVHTFMEIKDGQRIIGRFAESQTFYITYKDNKEFLEELNEGIVDLKLKQPFLENELMQEFYYSRWNQEILYTTSEKNYIDSKPEIKIGYMKNQYPFSYEDNNTFCGMAKQMFDESLKGAGIEYKAYENQKDITEALSNGEIDVAAYITELNDGEKGLEIIDAYAKVPLVMAMKKNNQHEEITEIATTFEFEDELMDIYDTRTKQIVYCQDLEECLKMLEENKVTAVVGGGYVMEHMLSTRMEFTEITITKVLSTDFDVYVAVNDKTDERLKSILSKTVTKMDIMSINEYTLRENEYPFMDVKTFIKSNSIVIIAALIVFIFMIIMISIYIIKNSKKVQNMLSKDTDMDIWNLHYFLREGEKKRNTENEYAVVYTNIIRMRQYNLVYGRREGMILLKKVAGMLIGAIDEDEICARMNNDHFVMLLRYEEADILTDRIDELREKIEKDIFEKTDNHLQIQFGVCQDLDKTRELQTLIEYATEVLDENDEEYASNIKFYNLEFEERMRSRHQKEKMLDTIDIEENFLVYYQNKVDIRTEKIVGAEALVRLADPSDEGKIKTPWYFVSYYEQTGRIVDIDFYVLRNVCKMLRRRLDENKRIVPISCNFSRLNFVVEGFSDRFEKVLEEYDISKEFIEVEITETLVVEQLQFNMINENIKEMKSRGIRLSIDDFGAGYSSLGIFEHVPASVIKLDRSFMLNHEENDRQIKIMRGIVKLSEELDAQVVCEGVETLKDVEIMKEIKAYIAQGYYYSKPVSEEEFERLLQQ